jgi:AmmeMemoRadiSam system protein B
MEVPGARARPAAVAGAFYPADSGQLAASVDGYLVDALERRVARRERRPKALIAPHAGYVYSGPVAASAYAELLDFRDEIERVVLLGPCHRVVVRGLVVPAADVFLTPLGPVPLDRAAIARLLELPQVSALDAAHAEEHSLEVHLPFLQRVLGDFRLVPLAVGDAECSEVAQVLEHVWGGDETLIVVSSDLSHYQDYETARCMDEATSRAIVALDAGGLGEESACGRVPVRGLLAEARRRGLRGRLLDLRSSGDTAGPRDRVVGYGSYVFG